METSRIGDICEVGDGAHAKIKRTENGVPYLTCRNLKNGGLDLSQLAFISKEDYAKWFLKQGKAISKPKKNDIIFSIIGTIGEPYLVNRSDEFGISSSVAIIRPDIEKLFPPYLYYWVKGPIFQGALYSIKGGVAQGYVSLEMIRSLPLQTPSLRTQRKIAGILSAYDDLIENNTRRIAILEEIAQALYREWFINFRFPGHESVTLIDSPLGKIPEGWEFGPLKKVAEVNGLNIKKGSESNEISYVDIASVSTGKIDVIRLLPFSEAPSRARRIVRHGDMIWSTVRPNRKSYSLILDPLPNMVVSTGFAVISGISVPFSYLYHALTTNDFVGYLVNSATGSAYPAVNSGDFERATILIPTQQILSTFHKMTEPLFLEQHCLNKKNEKLRLTRDLLLPKLISGQIDVENLEIDIGEMQDTQP